MFRNEVYISTRLWLCQIEFSKSGGEGLRSESGRLSGGKGERFFALTPDRPCPPTAAVLVQILVRSPDFSDCKRIVDGCVVLIVGIEGSTARTEEQIVGCVEERDGWHVDDHAVAPA